MNLKHTKMDWYDKNTDTLKCLMCGKYYKSLQTHIKFHKVSVDEYKEEFGIFKTTPLLAVSILESRVETTEKMRKSGKFVISKKGEMPVQLIGKSNNNLGINKKRFKEFDEFRLTVGERGRKILTGKIPWNKGKSNIQEIICKNCGKKHLPKHREKVEFCGNSCSMKYKWKNGIIKQPPKKDNKLLLK